MLVHKLADWYRVHEVKKKLPGEKSGEIAWRTREDPKQVAIGLPPYLCCQFTCVALDCVCVCKTALPDLLRAGHQAQLFEQELIYLAKKNFK